MRPEDQEDSEDKEAVGGEAARGVEDRAVAMRQAFDEAFARPREEREATIGMLILRVRTTELACSLEGLAGFEVDRRLVPLVGGPPGLLGLAGVRGKLVPVYSLAALLGLGDETGRWLALARGAEPVALSFHGLERFLRVPRTAVHLGQPASGVAHHISGLLRVGSGSYNLLDLPSVLAAVWAQAQRKQG